MTVNIFIYELPYSVIVEVTALLSLNDQWKVLARRGFSYTDSRIARLMLFPQPCVSFLADLSQKNYTVDELCSVLKRCEMYKVMSVIVSKGCNETVVRDEDTTVKDREGCLIGVATDRLRFANDKSSVKQQYSFSSISMLHSVEPKIVLEICNNFDQSLLIGRGGFGEVYKAKWNAQNVAVKRVLISNRKRGNSSGDQGVHRENSSRLQAITELLVLHKYPAENILPLLAYSEGVANQNAEDPNSFLYCLLYQYMKNGSVYDVLKKGRGQYLLNPILPSETPPKILSWSERINIARGVTCGLVHLHAHSIVHGDIKSANILLDSNYEPKIGDFGMARGCHVEDGESKILVSTIEGTQSYLPADYISSKVLTCSVDVFCLGIFFFELVTGLSPSTTLSLGESLTSPSSLRVKELTMRELMLNSETLRQGLVDSKCQQRTPVQDGSSPPHLLLYHMGKWCTKSEMDARPKVTQIFNVLEGYQQENDSNSIVSIQNLIDLSTSSATAAFDLSSSLSSTNPTFSDCCTTEMTNVEFNSDSNSLPNISALNF